MQWYYSKNGTQLGPVEQHELLAKIAAGEVTPSDLVWREGLPDWVPCGQVQELRMPGGYGPAPQPGADPLSPYAPPTAEGISTAYGPPVPSNGKATASLVLGIIATVFAFGGCGCLGIQIIAIPCGILAIVFGNQVKQAASLDPSLLRELGKVKAGIITGWIGVGLSVVFVMGFLVFFLFAGGHMK